MAIESHRPWFFEYHVSTQLSTQRAEILAHWLVNECVFLTDEAGAALKLNEDILHADVLRFGSLFSRLMFRAAPCRASIAARERTRAHRLHIAASNFRIFLRYVQGSCSRDALVRRDQPRLPHSFLVPCPTFDDRIVRFDPFLVSRESRVPLGSAPGSGPTLESRVTRTVGRDFEPDRKRIHRCASPRQLSTWNKVSSNGRLSSLTPNKTDDTDISMPNPRHGRASEELWPRRQSPPRR